MEDSLSIEQLESELLSLPRGDRLRLVRLLQESLDGVTPHSEIREQWADEALARADELDRHPEIAETHAQVMARVREVVSL